MYFLVSLFIVLQQCIFLSSSVRFCNDTFSSDFHTTCKPCSTNQNIECPLNTLKMTTGQGLPACKYLVQIRDVNMYISGCHHVCRRSDNVTRCCPGHWGLQCEECAGGSLIPCSGRGKCNDGLYGNGTCSCEPNFGGVACEMCDKYYQYGSECNQNCHCLYGRCNHGIQGDGQCTCNPGYRGRYCDEELETCTASICDANALCVENRNGTVNCICNLGWDGDGKTCRRIDLCLFNPCSANASCKNTSPGNFSCTCNPGYTGDGFICMAVNPCQTDNGGCELSSSECVMDAAGKSHCECISGYDNYQDDIGCTLVDLCTGNQSTCHPSAECKTVAPGITECSCKTGHIGDGTRCYGNLLERLKELNESYPFLSGQLSTYIDLAETYLGDTLRYHGPLTLFVTVEYGFDEELRSAMRLDEEFCRRLIKQQVVAGLFTIDQLANMTLIYTLQGATAEVKMKRKGIYKYRPQGSTSSRRILESDILAANGYIHVIDKIDWRVPKIIGDKHSSLYELIKNDGRYNRFEALMENTKWKDLLSDGGPYVIFAPSNGAWQSLSTGTLEYLQSGHGQSALMTVLGMHIVSGDSLLSEDMINLRRFTTANGYSVNISLTNDGQIQLQGRVNISQLDIPARNGYYHHIEAVLLPDSLPRRCDRPVSQTVKGVCQSCPGDNKCPHPDDVPLNRTSGRCRFWVDDGHKQIAYSGCTTLCNRTEIEHRCCSGFYSPECQPCPGAYLNPCNGQGKCFDGTSGNGSCVCSPGVAGAACEQCVDENRYGPGCSKNCTCVDGICDNGISGTGHCRPGTCRNTMGPDCDHHVELCGHMKLICHLNSRCVRLILPDHAPFDGSLPFNGEYMPFPIWPSVYRMRKALGLDTYSCVCNSGYVAQYGECVKLPECGSRPDAPVLSCHPQAECVVEVDRKTDPGMRMNTTKCRCRSGWVGDGLTYCHPSTPCLDHAQCPDNASCADTVPGEYVCQCSPGYHGNGTVCILDDPCTKYNGGCHVKATCVRVGAGERVCTCPDSWYGDGFNCLQTIFDRVMYLTDASKIAKLLTRIHPNDNLLASSAGNYTFFAPSDDALTAFSDRADNRYWTDTDNILTLISYHTADGLLSIEQLVNDSSSGIVDSLLSDYPLNVSATDQGYFVNGARVQLINVATINGYIHLIDKVLEPYPIPPERQAPGLSDLLRLHNFTILLKQLNSSGMLSLLINMDTDFTLFAPIDQAFDGREGAMTMDELKAYVIPRYVPVEAVDESSVFDSLLVDRFSLHMTKSYPDGMYYVNGDALVPSAIDMRVRGGVVHGVQALFSPYLNRCDSVKKITMKSPCTTDCSVDVGSICRKFGYPESAPGARESCSTDVQISGANGCRYQCLKYLQEPKCCKGYFGTECKACPGAQGEYTWCSGRGQCNDGMDGSGECSCYPPFTGTTCAQCRDGFIGANCNESVTCAKSNGLCAENAICTMADGLVACTCRAGFTGDGRTTCSSVCSINNGGCGPLGVCSLNEQTGAVNCTCPSGYRSITHYNRSVTMGCEKTTNPCDACSEHAVCRATREVVTCRCEPPYIGNGTICLLDLYNLLNKTSSTQPFFHFLKMKGAKSGTIEAVLKTLMQGSGVRYTIFIPQAPFTTHTYELITDKDFSAEMLKDLVVLGLYQLRADRGLHGQIFLASINGRHINVSISQERKEVLVNGVPVVQSLVATNGMIYVTESPIFLEQIHTGASTAGEWSSRLTVKILVASVVAIIVVILLVTLLVFRQRRKLIIESRLVNEGRLIAKFASVSTITENCEEFNTDRLEDHHQKHLASKSESCEIELSKSQGAQVNSFNNPLYQAKDDKVTL